jgi:hypothetical protein
VRFMACNILHGAQQTASALNRFVPDIHELEAELSRSNLAGLAKTHFAFSPQMPLAERTAAAIYVVRSPDAVLTSNYHYARRSQGGTADSDEAFDRYFDEFVRHRGDPRWASLGMGTWEQNVCSWLSSRHPFPILYIKYEDLSVDPLAACRKLAGLLAPSCPDDRLCEAVRNSSFDRLREIEESDIRNRRVGIFYKPYLQGAIDSGVRFMRAGETGGGKSRLKPEQRVRLSSTFRSLLAALGYPAA